MDFTMLFNAFWVGGLFCLLAQILIDKTRMTYVVAGVILTAIGVYEPLVKFAGCGATVPIIGFGYTLAKGVAKAIDESGLLGVLCGGVKGAACGISAAIFFGFVCSLLFKPKAKK